jgi:L-methionine (R)-S-oxide reductase
MAGREDPESYLLRLSAQTTTHGDLGQVLESVVNYLNCSAGTIHFLNSKSNVLELTAHIGIPPIVLGKIEAIPVGKGMAGLAAERAEPVQVCNLQKDSSGVARTGARDTKMEGSIAVPMIASGAVCGVLGVAKPVAYEFSSHECNLLLKVGAMIASNLVG